MRTTRLSLIAAALAVTVPLTACDDGLSTIATPPADSAPAASDPSAVPAAAGGKPARTKARKATSDLSGLRITDIKAGASVLIADDSAKRFLQIGDNGVDFTGTDRADTTMMALHPAAVPAANRVVIKPPFWNEEAGGGYCVADTPDAALKLEKCRSGRASQIWRVVPAGDSGLFELHGSFGVIGVKDGRITTSGDASTGLQVLPYTS